MAAVIDPVSGKDMSEHKGNHPRPAAVKTVDMFSFKELLKSTFLLATPAKCQL